jgi:hypothetical protein
MLDRPEQNLQGQNRKVALMLLAALALLYLVAVVGVVVLN